MRNPLKRLFCQHGNYTYTETEVSMEDEYAGVGRRKLICSDCGHTEDMAHGISAPSQEAYDAIRACILKEKGQSSLDAFNNHEYGSGWYCEFAVAISRMIRDGKDPSDRIISGLRNNWAE